MSQNLKFKKSILQKYLNSIKKISDTAIVDVSESGLVSISSVEDCTLYLVSKLETDVDVDGITLNLPSVSKLSKALDLISKDDCEFKLNSNNLEYKDNCVKFKYHLFDDGILTKSKLSLNKISTFKYDIEFDVATNFILQLLRNSNIFKDSTKLYLYTENDVLTWSLNDKTQSNTDTLTINAQEVDFELDEFIFKLDNFKFLALQKDGIIKFKINSEIGIANIEIQFGDITLNYIANSLLK